MGITGITNLGAVFDYIDGFEGDVEEQALEAFDYAGTFFFEHARVNAKFINDTQNLRNSIGYSVVKGGKALKENFGGLGGMEKWKAETDAGKKPLITQINGIGLVGLAGMQYGIYVEAMQGKSVISQSIPETEKLLERLFAEI